MPRSRLLLAALMTVWMGMVLACGGGAPRTAAPPPEANSGPDLGAERAGPPLDGGAQPPASGGEVPAGVTYTVIEETTLPGVKRQLVVRLNRRVPEAALRAIALKLKGSDPKSYDRTFIEYRLPGMEAGVRPQLRTGQAWATTHFTPELEVKVLGTTAEQHERLQREAAAPPPTGAIGRWMDEETALPGVIVLTREGGRVFMTKTFADGSKGRSEMAMRVVGGQTRFVVKGEAVGDYLVIDANGDLGHGDNDEGVWATSRRIKAAPKGPARPSTKAKGQPPARPGEQPAGPTKEAPLYTAIEARRAGSALKWERIRVAGPAEVRAVKGGRLLVWFVGARGVRIVLAEVESKDAGDLHGENVEGVTWELTVEGEVVRTGSGTVTLGAAKVLKADFPKK